MVSVYLPYDALLQHLPSYLGFLPWAWDVSTFWLKKKGNGEEIPLVQGKEQWLHFAGAAVKRYPTPKVRETQIRW